MLAGTTVAREASGPEYGIKAYTAREWDPEIELYYYRARYYDPEAGRFISEDPIRFLAGMNFYAYVENNPVRFVDPLGASAKDAWREWRRTSWNPYTVCVFDMPQAFEGAGKDRERHCWCSCMMQRTYPINPLLNPFNLAEFFRKGGATAKALVQVDF